MFLDFSKMIHYTKWTWIDLKAPDAVYLYGELAAIWMSICQDLGKDWWAIQERDFPVGNKKKVDALHLI